MPPRGANDSDALDRQSTVHASHRVEIVVLGHHRQSLLDGRRCDERIEDLGTQTGATAVVDQGRTTMTKHTEDEIDQAARRFEKLADELDPATTEIDHTDDLRDIAGASKAARADEVRLREAVSVARARGRSWNHIALALGVSRQAARQRFADKLRR